MEPSKVVGSPPVWSFSVMLLKIPSGLPLCGIGLRFTSFALSASLLRMPRLRLGVRQCSAALGKRPAASVRSLLQLRR